MTNSDLRNRAERICRLLDQIDGLKADLEDLYGEAKADGFSVAALKRAIKIARLDTDKRAAHDAQQMDLELYLAEIEGRAMSEAAE